MMACDDYYYLGTQLPTLAWNLDDLGAVAGAEFASGMGILNEHVSLGSTLSLSLSCRLPSSYCTWSCVRAPCFCSQVWLLFSDGDAVVQPPATAEVSTGYLEDAVAQWSVDRCKRRRTLHFPQDPAVMEGVVVEDLVQVGATSPCSSEQLL